MEEEWRPVVGYEGLYEISNLGRVKSLERVVTSMQTRSNGQVRPFTYHVKEKLLKQGRRPDGYADVSLSKSGTTTLHCVHRLLAEAWIPNPDGYDRVNHIDLDKTNNSLDNLEWVSNSGNVNHAVARYSNPQSIAIYCKETDTVYSSMGQCDKALGLKQGCTWKSIHESRDYGYSLSVATPSQVAMAKDALDAECSWKFLHNKKGRLHPIRKIKCIETQQIFSTLKEAALFCNGSQDSLRHSIRIKSIYKGLTFYYLDDAPKDEVEYQRNAEAIYYSNHCRSSRRKADNHEQGQTTS